VAYKALLSDTLSVGLRSLLAMVVVVAMVVVGEEVTRRREQSGHLRHDLIGGGK
jgi:hypothetical protein